MGLTTGGSTQSGTTTPGAAGQVQTALNQAGGLGAFATPSSLYSLTPGEQTFQGLTMANALPGSEASRAMAYSNPANNPMLRNYLNQWILPQTLNDSIARGFGGNSGAAGEASTRAASDFGLKALTGFGMPMAARDTANLAGGLGAAGLQRMSSLQDFGRIQNLLQSLLGYLPTSTTGNATQQGPGAAASLLNLGGGILGSLFNGGLMGSGGSLGGQLLGSAFGGLKSLFGGGSSTPSNYDPFAASPTNLIGDTTPSAVGDFGMPITDSGATNIDPMQAAMMGWDSAGGAM